MVLWQICSSDSPQKSGRRTWLQGCRWESSQRCRLTSEHPATEKVDMSSKAACSTAVVPCRCGHGEGSTAADCTTFADCRSSGHNCRWPCSPVNYCCTPSKQGAIARAEARPVFLLHVVLCITVRGLAFSTYPSQQATIERFSTWRMPSASLLGVQPRYSVILIFHSAGSSLTVTLPSSSCRSSSYLQQTLTGFSPGALRSIMLSLKAAPSAYLPMLSPLHKLQQSAAQRRGSKSSQPAAWLSRCMLCRVI